jgi:hypothetical protein
VALSASVGRALLVHAYGGIGGLCWRHPLIVADESPWVPHPCQRKRAFASIGRHRARREGAALLLATNLENSLRIAIERKLGLAEKHRTMLFEEEASPLRDFAARTRMGYALGLFGEETKKSLDIIRLIRNAFAHAPSPVRFSTPEIEEACALLKVPARVGAADDQKDTNATGRERFRLVCERIGTALRDLPKESTTHRGNR